MTSFLFTIETSYYNASPGPDCGSETEYEELFLFGCPESTEPIDVIRAYTGSKIFKEKEGWLVCHCSGYNYRIVKKQEVDPEHVSVLKKYSIGVMNE